MSHSIIKQLFLLSPLLLLVIRSADSDDRMELRKETIVSAKSIGGKLKCEPSAAMTEDAIVATWNDSYGGISGCGAVGTLIAWSISRDQGRTFTFGGYLPIGDSQRASCAADSWVRADEKGNFYITLLAVHPNSQEVQCYIMRKEDLGKWKKLPAVSLSEKKESLDRPSMSVNEHGIIGVVYTRLLSDSRYSIEFSALSDRDSHWNPRVTISDTTKKPRLCATSVFHQDTVWAVWLEGSSYILDEVWWTMSSNRGGTFQKPQLLFALHYTSPPAPLGYNMSNGLGPVILIDPPSIAFTQGSVSLVCMQPTDPGNKIALFRFDSAKNAWMYQQPVGQSADSTTKFFAALCATPTTKAVLYYDRRNAGGTSLTDVYLTLMDHEKSQDIKLDDNPTQWEATQGDSANAPVQRVFGDYITLTSHANRYLATWTDGRNGYTAIYCRLITLR
jgi:hypothetical protein